MDIIGATLILIGLTGIICKARHIYLDSKDPPREFDAMVAKTRLDTKKDGRNETYTYIVTFFLHELNKYLSFQVSQKIFDEILEKDAGVLRCNLKRQKFIDWAIKATSENPIPAAER